jgi:chemotaxis protein CheD
VQHIGLSEFVMTPDPSDVYLPAGHFHFGAGRVRVHTLLGTCVAIALWNPARKIGGLCHYLLPSRRPGPPEDAPPGLYADEVMGLFDRALTQSGTQAADYVVKIIGGGNMFPGRLLRGGCRGDKCTAAQMAACQSVGCKNISVARTLLGARGFVIAAEDIGGRGSRQVVLDLSCGDLWIKRGAAIGVSAGAAA